MSTTAEGRLAVVTTRRPRLLPRWAGALRGVITTAGPAQLVSALLQRLPDVAELTTPRTRKGPAG